MRRTRVELYRSKAEMCRSQAVLPQNAAQKDRWIKLDQQWSKLADDAKKDQARIRRAKRGAAAVQARASRAPAFVP